MRTKLVVITYFGSYLKLHTAANLSACMQPWADRHTAIPAPRNHTVRNQFGSVMGCFSRNWMTNDDDQPEDKQYQVGLMTTLQDSLAPILSLLTGTVSWMCCISCAKLESPP